MLDKETYRELYRKLDMVFPVPYDCGTICGKACCGVSGFDREMAEEDIQEVDGLSALFPPSFLQKKLCFVRCKDPLRCHRAYRPLQCRFFPTLPHLMNAGTKRERLVLIWNDMDLPYSCPLIEDEVELDKEWLATVYDVWQTLLEDPMVHDMVAMDSLDRMEDVGMPTVLWPKFRFHR